MSKKISVWICMSLMLIISQLSFADNVDLATSGSVKGIVLDQLGTLPGATVLVEGTSIGTSTDLNGVFSISNLDEGKYTLAISFIGYQVLKVDVSIELGKSTDLGNIYLAENNTSLNEVMVKGNFYPSQMRALSMKKASMQIMDVLASDAIGKLPDRNAAEAVQRIAGVSIERDHGEGRYVIVRGTPLAWNSTQMNGNRMPSSEGTSNDAGGRTSPLDIFPSEMIQYVQVAKAITPDMEGDAIGGSVNFITKTAPPERTLNVNLGYGMNNQAKKPIESASILYGDRSKNGKFGFLVSGTYWNRNWGTDNYEVEYDENSFAINTLELRDYLGKRTTYGFNAGLEYEFSTDNKVYARGIYTDFQDDETAAENIFSFSDEEYTMRRRRGITGINLMGGELGGNHLLPAGRLKIDWKVAQYATDMSTRKLPNTTRSGDPVYQMAIFTMPMTYNGLHSDGNKYLDIDAPNGYTGDPFDNIQPNTAETISPDQLQLDMLYGFMSKSYERDRNGQLDFTFDVSNRLKLKAGYKIKQKYLERGSPAYINVNMPAYGMGVDLSVADLETMPFPANGGYLTEIGEPYNPYLLDVLTTSQLDELFGDEFQQNTFYDIVNDENNPSSATAFFDGYETVNAGYLMGEYDVNTKVKLVGGVRYEHTTLKYNGNSVITDADGNQEIEKVSNTSDFGSFLPMAHIKYSPVKDVNLRFAYTRTFARANFADLNPVETRNDIFNTITRGNIDLKPTYSHNFDLMGEYFFNTIGYLTGGVFYKRLSNVIYTARTYEMVDNNMFDVLTPQNSDNGWLGGFEVGFSKRFEELPGFFSGFGVEANYTFTTSEMEVPEYNVDENSGEIIKTYTTESLPNQSKNIFNAALFYEKSKFSARIAGNYKGESLSVVQGNPENYRWYDKNFTIDLTTSYSITDKIKVYAEINNLTNEPLRYYQGNKNRPEQTEYYSIRGSVGVNISLF